MSTDERRERYTDAIWQAVKADRSDPSEGPDAYLNALADVAMAVADAEITQALNAERSNAARYLFERDAAQCECTRLRASIERAQAVLDEWYGTSDASALGSAVRAALTEDS